MAPDTLPCRALVLAAALAALAPLAAAGQTCDRSGCGIISCGSPARPAPRAMWGELQPVDPDPLPTNRDASNFVESAELYASRNWFQAVDVANGYLIAGLAHGIQVWDLHTDPVHPQLLGQKRLSSFPIPVNDPHYVWPLFSAALPDGNDNVAGVVGEAGLGLTIFDLTQKLQPRAVYQSAKKNGDEIYFATVGGSIYAFMGASSGDPVGGLFMYNATKALQFNGCSESFPAAGDTQNCAGVYLGRVGTRTSVPFVHGVDSFVAASGGTDGFVEIWDVSQPASPRLALTGLNSPPLCIFDRRTVYGVAMWKDTAGHYYLGLRTSAYDCVQQRTINEGRIYDVSCLTTGCNGLGSPLWSQELAEAQSPNFFVTFSRSGTVPYLYFGSDDKCTGGSQREWLFDVTSPQHPHDVTPATGYWGWYYRGGATGFNYVMPRRGKWSGSYFYRAGLGIMDIHQRTSGLAPLVDFSVNPTTVYAGSPVNFLDLSGGLPTSWTWIFQDATAAASSAPASAPAKAPTAPPP